MSTPLTEIEELAESIAEQYMDSHFVNVHKIAQDKNIELIHEPYGKFFLGQLVHESGDFFLHINKDLLPDIYAPRARFTLAHDYGHYFIDEHRNKLKGGISLSYDITSPVARKPIYELEADHFASHLIMPKGRFASLAGHFEAGINAILGLKNNFETSIECTAIHYTKLDLKPCLMIRWKPFPGKKYAIASPSLRKLVNISEWPTVKYSQSYLNEVLAQIEASSPRMDYFETVCNLSKWLASVPPGSKRDITGWEQTIKLGDHGALTLLIF